MRKNDWIAATVGKLQAKKMGSRPSHLRRSVESLEDRLVLSITSPQNGLALPQWFEHVSVNQSSGPLPLGGQSVGTTSVLGPAYERNLIVRLTP